MKYAVIAFFGVGLAILVWQNITPTAGDGEVKVNEPKLTGEAVAGKLAFEANCASCHGNKASGTKSGPPLMHDIYNPGHHPDGAFYSAVKQGVPQHHWPFGNMPAQPQVTDEQIALIVKYIRELQAVNGIVYREHKM